VTEDGRTTRVIIIIASSNLQAIASKRHTARITQTSSTVPGTGSLLVRQQNTCSAQQQKEIITGWQHSAVGVADFASKYRKK